MSDRVTPEQIAELKRLSDAATPGPWKRGEEHESMIEVLAPTRLVAQLRGSFAEGPGAMERDFAFIAAAREAVPALVAEVERLRTFERFVRIVSAPGVDIPPSVDAKDWHAAKVLVADVRAARTLLK